MRSEVWRLAAAARNRSLERPGVPPARHYDLAARSSLHGSGGNAGEGSAAPGPKSPRWSAERRASLRVQRDAPRLARPGQQNVRLSALRHPSIGVAQETRAQLAPRQRERLFEWMGT